MQTAFIMPQNYSFVKPFYGRLCTDVVDAFFWSLLYLVSVVQNAKNRLAEADGKSVKLQKSQICTS